MTLRQSCIGAASAIAFAVLLPAAQAAPLAGAASDLKSGFATTSSVEKAAYRRCWRRQGVRVCRWVGNYSFNYYAYFGSYSGSYAAAARAAASGVPMP